MKKKIGTNSGLFYRTEYSSIEYVYRTSSSSISDIKGIKSPSDIKFPDKRLMIMMRFLLKIMPAKVTQNP